MQKSYVVKRQIYFQPGELYLRAGDILVHDPSNANKLAVYRNQELITTTSATAKNLEGLAAQKPAPWIDEIVSNTETAVADKIESVVETKIAAVEAKIEAAVPEITEVKVAPVTEVPVSKIEIPAPSSAEIASAAVSETPKVNLTDLTKADLVAHAKDVHGLELDINLKKSELLQAVDEFIASK